MAITGPIALYNNLPIETQYYQPWRFAISGIALGVTTTVTVTVPSTTSLHYVVGQLVRLIIPPTFGCRQLNGQTGYVTSVTDPNQLVVNINSVGFDAYVASTATTVAQIIAIGDINSGPINGNGRQNLTTYIQGSFINISPN